jgi:hypothetical protein
LQTNSNDLTIPLEVTAGPQINVRFDSHSLGPILISVLKLGSNISRCIIDKMVLVIEENVKGEGLQQHPYDSYLQLESSAYSLFVLAIRSPHTKQKYLHRFGYFLDFTQVATKRGTPVDELCNKLAELAKNDNKWLVNCIFNYIQLLKARAESKEIKGSTLRNNLKPVKLFCEQMDIDVPWKKLTRGIPKERKYTSFIVGKGVLFSQTFKGRRENEGTILRDLPPFEVGGFQECTCGGEDHAHRCLCFSSIRER